MPGLSALLRPFHFCLLRFMLLINNLILTLLLNPLNSPVFEARCLCLAINYFREPRHASYERLDIDQNLIPKLNGLRPSGR